MYGDYKGGTYFDAVLMRRNYEPAFNGLRSETLDFVLKVPEEARSGYVVCVGETLEMLGINEYLERFGYGD